jgi:hypothetical protein
VWQIVAEKMKKKRKDKHNSPNQAADQQIIVRKRASQSCPDFFKIV